MSAYIFCSVTLDMHFLGVSLLGCNIPVVFYKLNTKYITISQNATKFIVLCYTIVSQLHVSTIFFRPSSGCVH